MAPELATQPYQPLDRQTTELSHKLRACNDTYHCIVTYHGTTTYQTVSLQ